MPDRETRLDALREEAARLPIPIASAATGYYGRPLLKPPVWTWEVPAYFFVGGAAGAAALVGAVAGIGGDHAEIARHARWIAAAGALLSAPLLIADLGRPSRFLNMLRVFKWRSPMSVGAWTLALFTAAAIASVSVDWLGPRGAGVPALGWLGHGLDLIAAATGLVLATYTGVLIGATAVPVWAKHARLLPLHFGASALGAAVSLIELTGPRTTSLNLIGIVAAATETLIGLRLELRRATVTESLFVGAGGAITRTGGVLSGPAPLVLRMLGASSFTWRTVAALSTLAGSLMTRFAWIAAGRRSAADARQAGIGGRHG